jgi:hypothetical protein
MCDIKCDVSTTHKHSFNIVGYEVTVSQGAYDSVSIYRKSYPFAYHQQMQFDSLRDFKKFCEKVLKCINQIENES